MIFKDYDIERLNLTDIEDFSKLFIFYMCGKPYNPNDINSEIKNLLGDIIKELNSNSLNYEQFNEILLLFNQDRVSRAFFKYLFNEKNIINLENLVEGIVRFRGLSMLNFGNFRFSYKKISRIKKLKKIFSEFDNSIEELDYINRPEPLVKLKKIEKDKKWYLGYLSKSILDRESSVLQRKLEKEKNTEKYEPLRDLFINIQNDLDIARKKGEHNTNTFLNWDYIDVYISTSMRKNCEFEETHEIIKKIFKDPRVQRLKIRYFDPTLSYCKLIRDKGLIEGLMLKRAKCTIYMIQESDTFGKDSELAATLAQKKPVIAFIPNYKINELYERIREYPLDYIKERLLIFMAEGVFEEDSSILKKIDKNSVELDNFIYNYLKDFKEYRIKQHFSLWTEEENKFKEKNPHFSEICKILAISTKRYWDKRARTLKEKHPLGMQIDLNSGVSNGVIVIRDIEKCVRVLEGILLNRLKFIIKHIEEDLGDKKIGYTGLYESSSYSIYRIVTDNKILTNSFWNFFYRI